MVATAFKAAMVLTALYAATGSSVAAAPGTGNEALAAQVLAASGADAATWMAKNATSAHDRLTTLLKHVLPNVTDEAATSAVDTEIQYEASALYQENIRLYATHFTDAQLRDLLTFYKSPGGQAWLAQTPLMSQERAANTRQISIDVVRRMVNSTCKAGTVCN